MSTPEDFKVCPDCREAYPADDEHHCSIDPEEFAKRLAELQSKGILQTGVIPTDEDRRQDP